ncbi:MAG: hypothetical protein QW273_03320 [Candidatus Pacearchaeota archaeon]
MLSLKDFEKNYEKEKGKKTEKYVVGYCLNNGRIFILDKKDFPKKGHNEEEFEKVMRHEMCHIFFRRFFYPKKISIWIEEGLCHFLSFGDVYSNVKNFISFEKIKNNADWYKNPVYNQSKEFFRFLFNNYGEKRVLDFLKELKKNSEETSFKKAFGKSLNNLEKKFRKSLKNE